jgi:hypothetical protein
MREKKTREKKRLTLERRKQYNLNTNEGGKIGQGGG